MILILAYFLTLGLIALDVNQVFGAYFGKCLGFSFFPALL